MLSGRYTDFWVTSNVFLARLYRSPLVTLAAIKGACPAGGCCLSLCCDMRIMTEQVRSTKWQLLTPHLAVLQMCVHTAIDGAGLCDAQIVSKPAVCACQCDGEPAQLVGDTAALNRTCRMGKLSALVCRAILD